MNLKTLDQAEVSDKRVLVRVDFNVPFDDEGQISDQTRLIAALPTLQYLIENGAKVIVMSHLGRPDPDHPDPKFKLDLVAEALAELLDKPVQKLNACVGDDVRQVIDGMASGDVVMLENTRFYHGEKKNDPEFAQALASLADLFVSDAFGAVHRAHASTVGVANHLPAYAGLLVQREVAALTPLLESPPKPFVLIVGGAKIDTKIGILKRFLDKADTFLVGGGLANTFLHAAGHDVGESLCQKDKLEVAQEIMLDAEAHGERFVLPEDVIVASEIGDDVETLDLPAHDVEGDMKILDIGSLSAQRYAQIILEAATIVWNGPMGLYEKKPFQNGTQRIADAVAQTEATTILGGGDTIDAIKAFGHKADSFDHISTGGGAMLEFLEGKSLPGLDVLKA